MDRRDWDARYAASDLVWGAAPNRFLEEELHDVPARGRVLDLACGEGRNAIWLAAHGWDVTAVDYSGVALERARRLARERQVKVEWIEADVTRFSPRAGAFQLAVIAYLQVPGDERRRVLRRATAALVPGGELLLIGHARLNLAEGVGGPRSPEVLWEPAEIRRELEELELVIRYSKHVRRFAQTPAGAAEAIDTLARAARPRRTRHQQRPEGESPDGQEYLPPAKNSDRNCDRKVK